MAYWYLRDVKCLFNFSLTGNLKISQNQKNSSFSNLVPFLFIHHSLPSSSTSQVPVHVSKIPVLSIILSSLDLWISKKQCPSSFPLLVKDTSRSAPNLFIASYWLLIFPFITNSLLFKSILRNGTTLKIHNSERLRALYVTRITNSLCLFCSISNSLPLIHYRSLFCSSISWSYEQCFLVPFPLTIFLVTVLMQLVRKTKRSFYLQIHLEILNRLANWNTLACF